LPIAVFGEHNLQNLQGALEVCKSIGVNETGFYAAISQFKGAAKRQEIIAKSDDRIFYRDFAHAPSKLKATVEAVKAQFPERTLVAVQELHTYSSLNKDFLYNYAHTFDAADEAIIYLNPKAVSLKKLELMDEQTLRDGFGRQDLLLFTEIGDLKAHLESKSYENSNLLMMSSGNYDDMDLTILKNKFNQ